MEHSLHDYLSGKIENPDFVNTANIQNNFLQILCWMKAFYEVSHMSIEEVEAIETRSKELFNLALSALEQERSRVQ